jgi:curved DNA-binding protein CbpA
MSSQDSLPSDWLNRFSDPYALLGISVAADDRRVLKRYRIVAKLLHPDSYIQEDEPTKHLATQLFARLINPAYQRLKQDKGRAESVAMLRFQVRRLNRDAPLQPKGDLAQKLISHPASNVDVFYEQAIATLASSQYQPFDQFAAITDQLGELNLVYLQLKMGEVFIREKRTGLVAANEAKPIQFSPVPAATEASTESYAQRHYRRAQEYMKKGNWNQAVQELRDAIKLEADKSEYHALLGLAYFKQNLAGMAKVYMRQALKLNPKEPLASKYASHLGIEIESPPSQENGHHPKSQPHKQPAKNSGLFGLFRSKK